MMNKNLNPTASNREVEAMIRYALDQAELAMMEYGYNIYT